MVLGSTTPNESVFRRLLRVQIRSWKRGLGTYSKVSICYYRIRALKFSKDFGLPPRTGKYKLVFRREVLRTRSRRCQE
jgi:hypothetical protein